MTTKQIKARLKRIAELLNRETAMGRRDTLWREYHALHAQLHVCNPGLPGD